MEKVTLKEKDQQKPPVVAAGVWLTMAANHICKMLLVLLCFVHCITIVFFEARNRVIAQVIILDRW